ncbi:CAP domain-containing protein [Peptococcaceae bacterium 1198_IL3148]
MTLRNKALVSILVTLFVFAMLVPMASAEAADNTTLEQQVVDQINQARVEKGVAKLQVDPAISAAAQKQAQALANSYSGSYGEVYKLMNSGQYQTVGASVLRSSNVSYLVNYQLRTANFAGLSDKYNLAGIGIADSKYFGKVCVEIFAKGKAVAQPQPQQPEQPKPKQPKPQQPQQPEQPAANVTLSEFQQQVVDLVNQERAKVGLKPLVAKADLTKVAQVKAEDMATNKYFSHTSPTYGSPFDMMKQFGIKYSYAGENIAMGYRSPEQVMEGWMNSEGHKKNILNPNFTEIGVGFTSNGYYWVQEFAKR